MTSLPHHIVLEAPPLHVRVATLHDAEALTILGAKTFYDTFASSNTGADMKLYLEKNFNVERLKDELSDKFSTFLLAQDASLVVGYAKLRRGKNPAGMEDHHSLEIERIYVIKEYIGKKVGDALMRSCLEVAANHGSKTVWLGVWEHNPRAIAFYKRWGFEEFGTHPFLLGTDSQTDLLMKKGLK